MTLWWLRWQNGVDGELHVGACKESGRSEAHTWVELGGHVLNDGAEVHQHYSRFDAPIAATVAESYGAGKADSNAGGSVASR